MDDSLPCATFHYHTWDCHLATASGQLRMWHCHPATALTNSLETAILPPSTDMPMSLFHYSHQHIWGYHSATSLNYRSATVTQLLLPLTCLPLCPTVTQLLLPPTCLPLLSSTSLVLLPSHYSDQHTCHCNPATVLTKILATITLQLLKPTNTLTTATQPLSSPKHLPLLPCNCLYQHTCHCLPATAPTNPFGTATQPWFQLANLPQLTATATTNTLATSAQLPSTDFPLAVTVFTNTLATASIYNCTHWIATASNVELLVAGDHNQLWTMASETVDPIDWSHPHPHLQYIPPDLHVLQCVNVGYKSPRHAAATGAWTHMHSCARQTYCLCGNSGL